MREEEKRMKVGIIGAGPAGMSCGAALAAKGIEVTVFEKDSEVGGLTKSIDLWGQHVDLGPHRFFSEDKHVNRFWSHFTGEDYVMIDRLTRIYYQHKFFYYPVRAMDALRNLGFKTAAECVMSYCAAQLRYKGKEKSFEEWVSNRFGYKLYSIFFKTYSERLWGMSCKELDADFARQRIKGLNLFEVIKDAFFGGGAKKHKTLLDCFAYPINGAGAPYERMAEYITKCGGKVLMNTSVKRVIPIKEKGCSIELEDGSIVNFDHVVSTAPITEVICGIPEIEEGVKRIARSLKYRNTTLVYLKIADINLFKDNWLYIHDPLVQVGRITNFNNWSGGRINNTDESILALEYWSYDNDKLWNYDDETLIALAKRDIVQTGLVKKESVVDGYVVRLHRSYPVYESGYTDKMLCIQKAADSINCISFIGRNGSFKYNNQDHSILMGIMAAKNIMLGYRKYNLWKINSDCKYQEDGKMDLK